MEDRDRKASGIAQRMAPFARPDRGFELDFATFIPGSGEAADRPLSTAAPPVRAPFSVLAAPIVARPLRRAAYA